MSETGVRADWATKDYYAELGVDKKATQTDIKKAYRKLARANHPDSNPGDTAKHEKFKAVAEAYDVVGDEEKRKKYDEVRRLYGGGFRGGFPGGSSEDAGVGFDLGDLLRDRAGVAVAGSAAALVRCVAPTSRAVRRSASPTLSRASRSASA